MPGREGVGPQAIFQFSKEIVRLERETGTTLSLGYELIFLPVPAGDPWLVLALLWGWSALLVHLPLLAWAPLSPHSFQELSLALLVRYRLPGAPSDSISCLGMGKWALQLIKLLEDLNQSNLHPLQPIIWSECTPDLVLLTSEAAGFGVAPQALKNYLPRSVFWCYKPSLLLYYSQILSDWIPDSSQFPW